jgi:hypothetical protein
MMPIDTLRSRARILMWLVTLPFACLLLLALTLAGTAAWHGGHYVGLLLIAYLPMCIYIWAIWMVRQALKSIAKGAVFDQVVPALLGRVGLALFVGALFNVIGTPLFTGLLYSKPFVLGFDGAAVTLGVVGATLVLLAQLLRQASAMRDELDAFF